MASRSRLDLHGGRLRVGESKTEAGLRDIELTAFLLGEMRSHLAALPEDRRGKAGSPSVPIFPTHRGGQLNASNIRNRLLNGTPRRDGQRPIRGVVERVNEKRAEEGKMLLPERVTPHTLRRTFATLSLAAGRDPRWVMGQLGHTDARLTLGLYTQVIQRQRVDHDLIWELMRFPDEVETRSSNQSFETRIETTGPTAGP